MHDPTARGPFTRLTVVPGRTEPFRPAQETSLAKARSPCSPAFPTHSSGLAHTGFLLMTLSHLCRSLFRSPASLSATWGKPHLEVRFLLSAWLPTTTTSPVRRTGESQGSAAWALTAGQRRPALVHSSSADPRPSLVTGLSVLLSLHLQTISLTETEPTRGGEVLPLFCHRLTRHHPLGPAGSPFIYFPSHLCCAQPCSYQSSSPSHNQNLPRVDARASNPSFPQRLAMGLEIKSK